MKPRRQGRKTHREILAANKAALDFLADSSGRPRMDIILPPAPKKRAPRRAGEKPLEKDIQNSILHYLYLSPKIAWAARFNSGMFMDGERYIRANSQPGLSDILAMARGGRLIAIEVKRPGQKPLPHQQAFLDQITQGGGLGICTHSLHEVMAALATLKN